MEVYRRSSWLLLLLGVSLLITTLQGVQGEVESEGPSESECRPYIEKALKELEIGETGDIGTSETENSKEEIPTVEITTNDSDHHDVDGDGDTNEEVNESSESAEVDQNTLTDQDQSENIQEVSHERTESVEDTDLSKEITVSQENEKEEDEQASSITSDHQKIEANEEEESDEDKSKAETESAEESIKGDVEAGSSQETQESIEEKESKEQTQEESEDVKDSLEISQEINTETEKKAEQQESSQETGEETKDEPDETNEENEQGESVEGGDSKSIEGKENESVEDEHSASIEGEQEEVIKSQEEKYETHENDNKRESEEDGTNEEQESIDKNERDDEINERSAEKDDSPSDEAEDEKGKEAETGEDKQDEDENILADEEKEESKEESEVQSTEKGAESEESSSAPEEELSLDIEIPTEVRERQHVEHLLKLDAEASETEKIINQVAEITLKELKKLYENAIKPLEVLYKYRDLSNRHFGDAEIFSKPLILFMGPWSGGKSSIINYLLDNEYNETSLRTGAEPSPAYFNILMYGEESEIIDGTQLAADFTFSGLQKFGQGLEERLRGVKLPTKLLEKVNIVEIPGILEVRKQVSRVFPFNDACQWFIDRADIIFLVYDPSKLDVGPETEAILDQLKGREHQTRIILNKADQVKPEELMRVQGALIWNISPLMSSAQPPIMYTTSLWSRPYESWAPVRLLQAQERAFLRDLRSAVDKRIENKIASARRFAVRVRNHAKMVDCYLTTYYNHKSVFGNRKQVADEIIEHPQDYHIYEGLSTLTNISRYDLPDPDVYKDFFKLNPLYDFQQLSATCTYFRGCPINRLDVAIAYDLPELVGKHKRLVENALAEANQTPVPAS